MIRNKINFCLFIISILLPTTFYGNYNDTYAEVSTLWHKIIRENYTTDADLINDVLIDSLQVIPNKGKDRKKQQEKQSYQLAIIKDLQKERKMTFNVDALAKKILELKTIMTNIAKTYNSEWSSGQVPNDKWNEAMAKEALQLINKKEINTNDMLKIINSIIENKAYQKKLIETRYIDPSKEYPLLKNAKKNIETVLIEKIGSEEVKQEVKEERAEEQAEHEKIVQEPIRKIEQEEAKPTEVKPEEVTTKEVESEKAKEPKVREPEKVILEEPFVEKPAQEKPIEIKPIALPEPQVPQTVEPEVKKEEPVSTTEKPVTKEEKEEIATEPLGKEPSIKQMSETNFKQQLSYFNNLITEATQYLSYNEEELAPYENIVNDIRRNKSFSSEEIESANTRFADLEEKIQRSHTESERAKAQDLLRIKAKEFNNFITNAEKNHNIQTEDIEELVKKASQEAPLEQQEIKNISKKINSITAVVNKALEKQKTYAQQEKTYVQEYPNRIAAEIQENKKKGLGTVIVHPASEKLMNYIKNLAADTEIKIIPDEWLSIRFGNTENNTLNEKDTFRFKQFSDENGTIEYLKHPDDKDTSTIIANPNRTYMRDSTIVPKIDKILTELAEKPTTIEPKQVREALEERIRAAKNKVLAIEKQNAAEKKLTEVETQIKLEEEKKSAEEKQQIKNLMMTMKITEEQAVKVFSQQKDLEKHLNYFAGLINEAKRIGLNEQKIQELKKMTDEIKNKKLYSLNINDIENETLKIKKTFDDLNKLLEDQLKIEKKLSYLPYIAKEIEINKEKGLGTVIVHPDAVNLINYIKVLAKEAKVEILPNAWTSIPFKHDILTFKQLSDGTIIYLKDPNEDSSTIIANPNWAYTWDYTLVPQIADKIKTETMDPQTVLSALQERINKANLILAPAGKVYQPIIEKPIPAKGALSEYIDITPENTLKGALGMDYAEKLNTIYGQDYSKLVNTKGVKAFNLYEQLLRRLAEIDADTERNQATKITDAKNAINNAYRALGTYHTAPVQKMPVQQPVPQYPVQPETIPQYSVPTENIPQYPVQQWQQPWYPIQRPWTRQPSWYSWQTPTEQQPRLTAGPREFPAVQPPPAAPQSITEPAAVRKTTPKKTVPKRRIQKTTAPVRRKFATIPVKKTNTPPAEAALPTTPMQQSPAPVQQRQQSWVTTGPREFPGTLQPVN